MTLANPITRNTHHLFFSVFEGVYSEILRLTNVSNICSSHMQRVTRPRGGINDWLHWLPVSLHKKLDYVMTLIDVYTRILVRSKGRKLVPLSSENGGSMGLSCILEADLKHIVSMVRETYEK